MPSIADSAGTIGAIASAVLGSIVLAWRFYTGVRSDARKDKIGEATAGAESTLYSMLAKQVESLTKKVEELSDSIERIRASRNAVLEENIRLKNSILKASIDLIEAKKNHAKETDSLKQSYANMRRQLEDIKAMISLALNSPGANVHDILARIQKIKSRPHHPATEDPQNG